MGTTTSRQDGSPRTESTMNLQVEREALADDGKGALVDLLLDARRLVARLCFHGITWRPFEFLPGRGLQIISQNVPRRRLIEAEDEPHARVGVPAIEMFGLTEVRVAAQQHLAKTTFEANL